MNYIKAYLSGNDLSIQIDFQIAALIKNSIGLLFFLSLFLFQHNWNYHGSSSSKEKSNETIDC